jgi:hypothetical protein
VEYFGKFEEGTEKQMNLETEKMVDIFGVKSLQLLNSLKSRGQTRYLKGF